MLYLFVFTVCFVVSTPTLVSRINDKFSTISKYHEFQIYPWDFFSSSSSIFLSIASSIPEEMNVELMTPEFLSENNGHINNTIGVFVEDGITFLGDMGMTIYNSSNSSSLTFLSSHNSSEESTMILGGQSREIVFIVYNVMFEIFDISTISSPSKIASVQTNSTSDLIECGTNLICLADINSGLGIFNISNISNPIEIGYSEDSTSYSISFDGDKYVYISEFTSFRIVDISNLTFPETVSSIPTTRAVSVVSHGNYAFVGDLVEGLIVVEVTNKSFPLIISKLSDTITNNTFLESLFMEEDDDDHIYMVKKDLGVLIIDISNKSNPYIESVFENKVSKDGSTQWINTNDSRNVHIQQNLGYLASGKYGLKIFRFGGIQLAGYVDVTSKCGIIHSFNIVATDSTGSISTTFHIKTTSCTTDDNEGSEGGNNGQAGLAGLSGLGIPVFVLYVIYEVIGTIHLLVYYALWYLVLVPIFISLSMCMSPVKFFQSFPKGKRQAGGQIQLNIFQLISGATVGLGSVLFGMFFIFFLAQLWLLVDIILCFFLCLVCCLVFLAGSTMLAVRFNAKKTSKVFAHAGQELVEGVKPSNVVTPVVQGIASVVTNATTNPVLENSIGNNVSGVVTNLVENTVSNVGTVVENGTVVATEATTEIVNTITSTIGEIQQNTAQIIPPPSQILQNEVQVVSNLGGNVVQGVSNIGSNVLQAASNVGNNIGSGAVQTVTNVGNNVGSNVVDVMTNMTNYVGNDNIGSNVVQAVSSNVGSDVVQTVTNVGNTVGNVVQAVSNFGGNVVQPVQNTVSGTLQQGAADIVDNAVSETISVDCKIIGNVVQSIDVIQPIE